VKRRNKIYIAGIVIFTLIVLNNCGESEEARLQRRLNNFRKALPLEIREKFDKGEYEEAGRLLDERLQRIKSYLKLFPDYESKRKFIRGDYNGLEKYIKNIPKEDLEFNRKIYKIIDYECIPTFNGYQMVDYFRVYFKEKLERMKNK